MCSGLSWWHCPLGRAARPASGRGATQRYRLCSSLRSPSGEVDDDLLLPGSILLSSGLAGRPPAPAEAERAPLVSKAGRGVSTGARLGRWRIEIAFGARVRCWGRVGIRSRVLRSWDGSVVEDQVWSGGGVAVTDRAPIRGVWNLGGPGGKGQQGRPGCRRQELDSPPAGPEARSWHPPPAALPSVLRLPGATASRRTARCTVPEGRRRGLGSARRRPARGVGLRGRAGGSGRG